MAYVARILTQNVIPVSETGESLGNSHQLYKNAVVYVEATLSEKREFNHLMYYYVYTYGRTSDGYVIGTILDQVNKEVNGVKVNVVNSNLYPASTPTLPNGNVAPKSVK